MEIKFTVVCDMDETDVMSYEYLIQPLRELGHNVIYNRYYLPLAGASQQALNQLIEQNNIDTPCDIHIFGRVYCAFKYELKNAKKVIEIVGGDDQDMSITNLNLQLVVDDDKKSIILPYTNRKFFKDCIYHVERESFHKEIDVLWCGSDCYTMRNRNQTRAQWLDEFESLVKAGKRLRFIRFQKLFCMQVYAELIKKSKMVLHLTGLAEHCYRIFEALHLGSCLVAHEFKYEKFWKKPPALWFDTPKEAYNTCLNLQRTGKWRDLARIQNQWYRQEYSEAELVKWGQQTAKVITA